MSRAQHTPTPYRASGRWIQMAHGMRSNVARIEAEDTPEGWELAHENAAFVVRAANNHEALVHLAKQFERSVLYDINKDRESGDDEGANMKTITLNLIRAAIAKAESI